MKEYLGKIYFHPGAQISSLLKIFFKTVEMFHILIRSFRRQHHLIFNHWEIEINEKSSQSYGFCPREHEYWIFLKSDK